MNTFSIQMSLAGSILSKRDVALALAEQIENTIPRDAALILHFAGVQIATTSFLDELLLRLRVLVHVSDSSMLIVVGGMDDVVAETMELVLWQRKLALATVTKNQIELLGGSRLLTETFEAASRLATFTATELADELKVKLPDLRQRLDALLEVGAVTREPYETVEGGKRYKFRAPSKKLVATA